MTSDDSQKAVARPRKGPPGTPPPALPELVRAQDRLSFLYLERCVVHRESNAITAQDDRGITHIPAAGIGALLLGPGTRVTHQAMMLIAESGATAVWVGEHGVRYYAHGRSSLAIHEIVASAGCGCFQPPLAPSRGASDVRDAFPG